MRVLLRLAPALVAALFLGSLGQVPHVRAQDDQEDPDEIKKLDEPYQAAMEAMGAKDYKKALEAFEKLLPRFEKAKLAPEVKKQVEPNIRYDYACALAATGKKDDALKSFCRAVELGYKQWRH